MSKTNKQWRLHPKTLAVMYYDRQKEIICSVCYEPKPKESYRNEGQEHQSRTNCVSCYEMKSDAMKALGDEMERLAGASTYRSLVKAREKQLAKRHMTKAELMCMLKDVADDDYVFIRESGYYCEGHKIGELYEPELHEFEGIKAWEIGHGGSEAFC